MNASSIPTGDGLRQHQNDFFGLYLHVKLREAQIDSIYCKVDESLKSTCSDIFARTHYAMSNLIFQQSLFLCVEHKIIGCGPQWVTRDDWREWKNKLLIFSWILLIEWQLATLTTGKQLQKSIDLRENWIRVGFRLPLFFSSHRNKQV